MGLLLKLLIFLLSSLLIVDIYTYFVFLRKRRWWAVAIFGLWLLFVLGVLWFFVAERTAQWRTVFLTTLLAVSVPQTIFAIFSLLDLPLRKFFRGKRMFAVLGGISAAVLFFVILYGSIVGSTKFTVREVEFSSPELPEAFDGYRIVQMSDIHLKGWGTRKREIMERMVQIANAQNADAIMITGDLVHHIATELNGVEDVLGTLKAPDGVWSVLGNHDYGPYYPFADENEERANLEELKRREEAMGWILLNNDHRFVERQGEKIAFAGVENAGDGSTFADYSDLGAALEGIPDSMFSVLMSHDPSLWRREVLGSGVDLTLSGHTHGGQFTILGLSFARLVYREWRGMYRENGQGLYVNVGIGQNYPIRFGVWPEITVITLRRR